MTTPTPSELALYIPAAQIPRAAEILRVLEAKGLDGSIIIHPSSKDAAEALRIAGILNSIGPDQYRKSTAREVIL